MSLWFHLFVRDTEALARAQAELLKSLPKMTCGACGSETPHGYWHSCKQAIPSRPKAANARKRKAKR